MAAIAFTNPMTADEIAIHLKGLTTDLSFLLGKEGFSQEIQAKLGSL
jgi:hypothetical protein